MRILVLVCILLMQVTGVLAHGHLWYDRYAGLENIKKVVILPIEGEKDFFEAEGYLDEKLEGKIEDTYFSSVAPANRASEDILAPSDHYEFFLHTQFADEKERAAAVRERLAADAYLVCRVRENRVQTDWSPETYTTVTITNYMYERGGPHGDRRYNEHSYTTGHLIPGGYVYLHCLDLDWALYDAEGNPLMLYNTGLKQYGTSEVRQFKELLKEFAREMKDARKALKKAQKEKKEREEA